MAFDLRELRFAVAAASIRSFNQAARALKVKQQTLSKRILALERDIGIQIFQRSTRGAIPTEAGARFLDSARHILDDVDRLIQQVHMIAKGEAGALTIGFSGSLSAGNLRATLAEFIKDFPQVRLMCVEAGRDRLRANLQTGAVDVAILVGETCDAAMTRRPLWSERILVALPDSHELAQSQRIYWPDLRHEKFTLSRDDPGPDLADLLTARIGEPGHAPDVTVAEISRENVLNMISLGRFLTLAAENALGVNRPGVVFREIHDLAGQEARISLAAHWRDENDNRALHSFFALLGERYPSP